MSLNLAFFSRVRNTCVGICTLLFFAAFGNAAKFKTPWLSGPVIDEAHLLTEPHAREIVNLAESLRLQGGPQLQVFITSSLQGFSIEEASISIVDNWKLGDEKRDDGVLFLIAPTERKLRIEVGQGLEGVIPDAYAKRINEDIVVPYFKKGQFSEGVRNGVLAIVGLIHKGGLENLEKLAPSKKSQTFLVGWPVILLWLVVLILSRSGLFGRGLRSGLFGGHRAGRHSGGWGGGGWGGGRSGGGWSGGGGGFSGGGSSSSW